MGCSGGPGSPRSGSSLRGLRRGRSVSIRQHADRGSTLWVRLWRQNKPTTTGANRYLSTDPPGTRSRSLIGSSRVNRAVEAARRVRGGLIVAALNVGGLRTGAGAPTDAGGKRPAGREGDIGDFLGRFGPGGNSQCVYCDIVQVLRGDQVIRENPASRGTETSAEVLVGPPGRMVSNAGPQQWYRAVTCLRRRPKGPLRPASALRPLPIRLLCRRRKASGERVG